MLSIIDLVNLWASAQSSIPWNPIGFFPPFSGPILALSISRRISDPDPSLEENADDVTNIEPGLFGVIYFGGYRSCCLRAVVAASVSSGKLIFKQPKLGLQPNFEWVDSLSDAENPSIKALREIFPSWESLSQADIRKGYLDYGKRLEMQAQHRGLRDPKLTTQRFQVAFLGIATSVIFAIASCTFGGPSSLLGMFAAMSSSMLVASKMPVDLFEYRSLQLRIRHFAKSVQFESLQDLIDSPHRALAIAIGIDQTLPFTSEIVGQFSEKDSEFWNWLFQDGAKWPPSQNPFTLEARTNFS